MCNGLGTAHVSLAFELCSVLLHCFMRLVLFSLGMSSLDWPKTGQRCTTTAGTQQPTSMGSLPKLCNNVPCQPFPLYEGFATGQGRKIPQTILFPPPHSLARRRIWTSSGDYQDFRTWASRVAPPPKLFAQSFYPFFITTWQLLTAFTLACCFAVAVLIFLSTRWHKAAIGRPSWLRCLLFLTAFSYSYPWENEPQYMDALSGDTTEHIERAEVG
jgi:hypothetical protein